MCSALITTQMRSFAKLTHYFQSMLVPYVFDALCDSSYIFLSPVTDYMSFTRVDDAELWQKHQAIKLCLDAGDFAMWDSRTVHCNHPCQRMPPGREGYSYSSRICNTRTQNNTNTQTQQRKHTNKHLPSRCVDKCKQHNLLG